MTETICGECGGIYSTEEQATKCADYDLARSRIRMPWRKCHPMCDRSAWECWRDNSWWHTSLCMGWPWLFYRIFGRKFAGFPGPLYWLCPDCRALHKAEKEEHDG